MHDYGTDAADCRMAFLQRLLDDPDPEPCGRCDRCTGPDAAPGRRPGARRCGRRPSCARSPSSSSPASSGPNRSKLAAPSGGVEAGGRSAGWGDGGWGTLVAQPPRRPPLRRRAGGRAGRPGPRVAPRPGADVADLRPVRARPDARSPTSPTASAPRSGLPFHPVVEQSADREPQAAMANSARQHANVGGAFDVAGAAPRRPGPAPRRHRRLRAGPSPRSASLLRDAGCPAVHPLAVADGGAS